MRKLLATLLLILALPSTSFAAIAFDNSAGASGNGNTGTLSLTTAGANELIVLCTFDVNTGATNITATVDGSNMTQITSSQQGTADANKMQMFYFLGTSAGAHTIAYSSANVGGLAQLDASSYNGVSQTAQPDNFASTTDDSLISKTVALTINTANSWEVLCGRWGGQIMNASTGSTKRQQPVAGALSLFDSNGPLSTGNNNMIITTSGAQEIGTMEASFKPFTAAAATYPFYWNWDF